MDTNFTRLSDGELAQLFAAGETNGEEAFRELVRRHGAMVLRTCRRITGSATDGEDAAQMVFATLAARAGELTASRSLAGWLYSTAWHVSRRTRRASLGVRRREHDALRPGPTDWNGELDDETVGELYRAIEMLPPEYCAAIVLHHLQGLTVSQVSELMGCAPGTTAARLSRGRAMMRERLALRALIIPSVAALEAALLAETMRRERIASWVTDDVNRIVQSAKANGALTTACAGAAAVAYLGATSAVARWGTGAKIGAGAGVVTFPFACKWALAVCGVLVLGTATLTASPILWHSVRSFNRTHMSAGGSASAESRAAGMSDTSALLPTSHSGGGGTTAVPEPGSLSMLAIGATMLLRRRRGLGQR